MKIIILLIAGLLLVSSRVITEQETYLRFQQWKSFNDKIYRNNEEEQYRFAIFKDNLKFIEQYKKLDQDAEYGPTKFADLTPEEFESLYLTLKPISRNSNVEYTGNLDPSAPPTEFDWQEKGAVTDPRNQGGCGSCWAFSAVGCLEGQQFLKHQKLINLSEQQLVDCDNNDEGCNGGFMDTAFQWLKENGGIMTREDYPYKGFDDQCHFVKEKAVVQVSGFTDIEKGNEDAMLNALFEKGPLSVALNASMLQFYIGGIFNPPICSKELNHGVTGTGYGAKGEKLFWRIKNSWGAGWGEKGYFRILRGKDKCGISQATSWVEIM